MNPEIQPQINTQNPNVGSSAPMKPYLQMSPEEQSQHIRQALSLDTPPATDAPIKPDIGSLQGSALKQSLKDYAAKVNLPQETPKTITGFAGNIVKSGAGLVGGLAESVAHPINTITNLGKIAIGGAESAYSGVTGKPIEDSSTQAFKNVINYFGERYGGNSIGDVAQHIGNTAYKDPMGFLLDISSILGGGAGLVGKIGELSDIARAGEIAKVGGSLAEMSATSGSSAASKISQVLGKAAEYSNPFFMAGKTASGSYSAAKDVFPKNLTAENIGGRLNDLLLRPLSKEYLYGREPGLQLAKDGIVFNSIEDAPKVIGEARKQAGIAIGENISKADPNIRMNLSSALKPIDEAIAENVAKGPAYQKTVDRLIQAKEGLTGIFNLEEGKSTQIGTVLLDRAPADLAQKFKQSIGDQTIWEGTAHDTPVNQALSKSYRIVDQMLDKAIPGIKEANERFANLLSAESSAKRIAAMAHRSGSLGMLEGLGMGTAFKELLQGNVKVAVGLATGTILKYGIESAAARTRIAKFLAAATPEEKAMILAEKPEWGKITATGLTESGKIQKEIKNQ